MVLKYSYLDSDTIECLNDLMSLDMPIKDSLTIFSVSKKINEHIEIKTNIEQTLINKYVERDENGKIKFVLDSENNITDELYINDFIAYKTEMALLNDKIFEINFEKININSLKNIKPKVLLKLEWLFSF